MNTDALPTLKREDIPWIAEMTEEQIEEYIQQWQVSRDELAARGSFVLDFPQDRSYGLIHVEMLCPPGDAAAHARGQVEIDATTQVTFIELNLPDAKTVAALPLRHVPAVDVVGLDNETAMALARSQAKEFALKGEATQSDVDHHREECVPTPEEAEECGLDRDQMEKDFEPYLVGGEKLTDDVMRAFAGRGDIEMMDLSRTVITDGAIAEVLPTLVGLRLFRLQSETAFFSDLDALNGLSALEVVALSGPHLTGEALNGLPVLPGVLYATFSGEQVLHGLDISALAHALPKVQELDIHNGTELKIEDLLLVRLAFPGVSVNGTQVSRKALMKVAARLGIEVSQPQSQAGAEDTSL